MNTSLRKGRMMINYLLQLFFQNYSEIYLGAFCGKGEAGLKECEQYSQSFPPFCAALSLPITSVKAGPDLVVLGIKRCPSAVPIGKL